jgi:hypothetical protein
VGFSHFGGPLKDLWFRHGRADTGLGQSKAMFRLGSRNTTAPTGTRNTPIGVCSGMFRLEGEQPEQCSACVPVMFRVPLVGFRPLAWLV